MAYVRDSIKVIKEIDPNIMVEQAAGITCGQEVYDFIMAGSEAAGAASGIMNAADPIAMIDEMIAATRRAADDLKNRRADMVYRESLKLQSRDRAVSFHDVTEQVKEITAKSGMKNGICVVYSHHTTCSVITQECAFDMSMTGLETLQQDLVNVFEEWIPTCRYEGMYLHPGRKALDFAESVGEDNFGCHNTDAHLRSSIIGRNVTIVMESCAASSAAGSVYFASRSRPRCDGLFAEGRRDGLRLAWRQDEGAAPHRGHLQSQGRVDHYGDGESGVAAGAPS